MQFTKKKPFYSTFRMITAHFWVSEILGFYGNHLAWGNDDWSMCFSCHCLFSLHALIVSVASSSWCHGIAATLVFVALPGFFSINFFFFFFFFFFFKYILLKKCLNIETLRRVLDSSLLH